jgi:hypothetical protein
LSSAKTPFRVLTTTIPAHMVAEIDQRIQPQDPVYLIGQPG